MCIRDSLENYMSKNRGNTPEFWKATADTIAYHENAIPMTGSMSLTDRRLGEDLVKDSSNLRLRVSLTRMHLKLQSRDTSMYLMRCLGTNPTHKYYVRRMQLS